VSQTAESFDESPLRNLPVRLALFEGPLDLLLHLCRDNKVDIKDIPIAAITEQYLAYLEVMRTMNLEVAGEFLVVARHAAVHQVAPAAAPDETAEGEEGEDPRRELVQQLIEYQRFKEAGRELRALEERRSSTFTRESLGPEGPPRTDFPLEVSLFDLLAALRRVIEQMPKTDHVEIQTERLSVAQRIAEVLELMADGREMAFEDLFRDSRQISDVVITFLAVLELVRLRLIRVWQARHVRRDPHRDRASGTEGLEPELFGDAAGPTTGRTRRSRAVSDETLDEQPGATVEPEREGDARGPKDLGLLKEVIEALVFVHRGILPPKTVRRVLGEEFTAEEIAAGFATLREEYEGARRCAHPHRGRGRLAVWHAGGPGPLASKKTRFYGTTGHLSRPTMETLAIIAYKQPVTRAEIEAIRGRERRAGSCASFSSRKLVRILGTRTFPQPMVLGTRRVLELFGLNSVADLPPLRTSLGPLPGRASTRSRRRRRMPGRAERDNGGDERKARPTRPPRRDEDGT